METDSKFFEIFRSHPEWIADLMNDPFPDPAEFLSITTKRAERRLDGFLNPFDVSRPLMVIEFQLWPSDNVFLRTVEEMIAVERLYPNREVRGIVFFASEALNKFRSKWEIMVDVYYLDKELAVLAERNPSHPLPKLLAPVFEKSEEKLEKEAATLYQFLQSAEKSTPEQRETLCTVFQALLIGRFKNKTLEDIQAMMHFPDLTETRAGQDLIAIGRKEGREEGREEGSRNVIIGLLRQRFPMLSETEVAPIRRFNPDQLQRLAKEILDFVNPEEVKAWLAAVHK
jgi:predicted transposase YdaD